MMLFINGFEIELGKTRITRTLQVNDIINLENRQANYSATYKLPKTAKNVRSFNQLGINGNLSNIPYQRNEAYLYAESGECLVYNGWAIIKETSENYSINIVDGNIDLYKAIDNLTLSDLDLSDINHFKTLDNVVGSFDDSVNYKYILADYNGKALYDTDKINIDYLVPSIPISYLWNKIFDTFGFTYSGEVFNTFNYQNLYITYPKGTADANPEPEIYYTNASGGLYVNVNGDETLNVIHSGGTVNDGVFLTNDIGFVVPSEGTYIIESDLDIDVYIIDQIEGVVISNYTLDIFINGSFLGFLQSGSSSLGENPMYLQLNQGDIITLQIGAGEEIDSVDFNSGNISYNFLSGYNVDFNETFIDFSIKDFIKAVLNRFALTPFKDRYSNNYNFLTLYELLQNPEIDDWSASENKFISTESEVYIYGSYAQQNNMLYKYNDEESDYYNGSININNVNLEDSKDIIKSKIYAPEKIPSNELPKETNVYKIWNKEVNDDGNVTYKELEKRFYLMRSDTYSFGESKTIGSEVLQTETTITSAPFESFFKLPFEDIIAEYYLPLYQILNKAQVTTEYIYLNDIDIENMRFDRLKWIEEKNSYYLLNKVSNYSEKGATKCEMIKVDYVNTFLI